MSPSFLIYVTISPLKHLTAKYHVEEALRIQAVEVLNHKSDAKNGMNKPAPASPSSTGTRQIGVIAGNDNI